MNKLWVYKIIWLWTLVSCSESKSTPMKVTAAAIDFSPFFIPTTNIKTDNLTMVPARSLRVEAKGGTIVVKWSIPKYYTQSPFQIGYRVFVKEGTDAGLDGWDFGTFASGDRSAYAGLVIATDKKACSGSGECFISLIFGGPKTLQVAVMASDSVEDTPYGGTESAVVTALVTTTYEADESRYNIGFIDGQFGGGMASDGQVQPTSLATYRFVDPLTVDPWLLPGDGFISSVAHIGDVPGYGLPLISESPILGSSDKDGEASTFADKANHRIILKSRPSLVGCESSRGTSFYNECVARIRASKTVPKIAIGQPTSADHYTFETNPLGPTRSIQGGTYASTVARDKAGDLWLFVADRARILVRKGLPGPCSLENVNTFNKDTGGQLEDGSDVGPEGSCGFMWSIGSASPRLTCGLRADGRPATGDQACSAADDAKTMADASAPSNQSLRYPGMPAIIDDDLYIPDGGNSRVVRLPNFKTALATCGRLKSSGSPSDERCVFDRVLGQIASASGDDQMTRRKCVRGSERGGKSGLATLPDFIGIADPLEPSCSDPSDPTCDNNTGTGVACLLDTTVETIAATPTMTSYTKIRRSRQALDFKYSPPPFGFSMVSPSTGLLSDDALSMFRFPISVHQDYKGRILVTDVGQTMSQESSSAPTYSIIGTRVMVWNRNPLNIPACLVGRQCEMTSSNICEGTECSTRECHGLECQAYTVIGQKSAKTTYSGFTGLVRAPKEGVNGFIPIVSVDIPLSQEGRGIWAVSGQNRHIYRWVEIDQFETPILHNIDEKNGFEGAVVLGGAFSGIEVDTNAGFVTALDSLKDQVLSWFARPSGFVGNVPFL